LALNNSFVDHLQGTILHEHWRVEFRRRYFTQLPQLQRTSTASRASKTSIGPTTATAPAGAPPPGSCSELKTDERSRRKEKTVNTCAVLDTLVLAAGQRPGTRRIGVDREVDGGGGGVCGS
jgi:hypothetical protein